MYRDEIVRWYDYLLKVIDNQESGLHVEPLKAEKIEYVVMSNHGPAPDPGMWGLLALDLESDSALLKSFEPRASEAQGPFIRVYKIPGYP